MALFQKGRGRDKREETRKKKKNKTQREEPARWCVAGREKGNQPVEIPRWRRSKSILKLEMPNFPFEVSILNSKHLSIFPNANL